MRLVTFSRAMAPHGTGDTRLVSDEEALRLKGEDAISSSEPWPAAQKPRRQVVQAARLAGVPDKRIAE